MKVLLQMPGAWIAKWEAALRVELPEATIHRWPDSPGEVDFALVWKPPPDLFEQVAVRRAIVNLGAGVDALLRVPTLPAQVPILRLEDAGMAEQMQEYATYAVLRAYREFPFYESAQRDRHWAPRRRLRKDDFGVGIMGFGILGRAVAQSLAAFRFPLAAWSRTRHEQAGVEAFAGPGELRPFLARARVLICLLPSTPATRGLLDRTTLGALPPGAHLVNLSRGDLVVDGDLTDLLDSGHLASAMLDVFHDEPLPQGHRFWHHPAVTVTPHVSAVTRIDESVAQVARKLRSLAEGGEASGTVDVARGY